jgi:hypothetical protein
MEYTSLSILRVVANNISKQWQLIRGGLPTWRLNRITSYKAVNLHGFSETV